MSAASDAAIAIHNSLLAAALDLGAGEFIRSLRPVQVREPEEIYAPGSPIERVWFPQTCVFSVVATFGEGEIAEMATIGREGMAGLSVILGARRAEHLCMVQMRGEALTADADAVRKAVAANPKLRDLLLAYIDAHLGQVMQTVACNSTHDAASRCARWLLMSHDRGDGQTFPLTQEFLAQMIGVHRPTVSLIAQDFQARGLIRYSRGSITVTDRPGLEQASCSCYAAIRAQFAARMPYAFS